MTTYIRKITKKLLIVIFFLIFIFFIYFFINIVKKGRDEVKSLEPIVINLLTSVHPDLSWIFKPSKSKILVMPGEVKTIEYVVENLGIKSTTGIATFSYYPNQFGNYISKLNCFCYDAKTLKPNEKDIYSVVLLIDPEVTKDTKTKEIKEVTIQFTFFDYNEYKENKN
jgi:cytochrome c oxidase assembly protein Cox11